VVTTVYQRDSSSKRPRASVVLAVRSRAAPWRCTRDVRRPGLRAPVGGAFRRSWTPDVSRDQSCS